MKTNNWLLGKVVEDFRAPKDNKGQLVYKLFKKDSSVTVQDYNQASVGNITFLPVYKTKDGYIIPRSNVIIIGAEKPKNDLGSIPEAQVVKNSDFLSNESKGKLANIGSVNDIIKNEVVRSKYMVNGALVGGVLGLAYAMYKGDSKIMYAVLGVVGGGFVGTMVQKITK